MNGLTIQWKSESNPSSGSIGKFKYFFDFVNPPTVVAINKYFRHLDQTGVFDVDKNGFYFDTQFGSTSKVPFNWIAIGY